MRVADFRTTVSALSDVFASLRGCTVHERVAEGKRVRIHLGCVRRALEAVKRAQPRDLEHARSLVAAAERYIAEAPGLAEALDRAEAADANFCRLAFAGEYR